MRHHRLPFPDVRRISLERIFRDRLCRGPRYGKLDLLPFGRFLFDPRGYSVVPNVSVFDARKDKMIVMKKFTTKLGQMKADDGE